MAVTLGSTGVTFPDGTTQTTAVTGSGNITSLNAETGAITNTAKNAIGSYVYACVAVRNTTNVVYTAGTSTISGSSLGAYFPGGIYSFYTPLGNFVSGSGFQYGAQSTNVVSNMANLGLTGTWRAMGSCKNTTAFGKDSGDTGVTFTLWVRVS